MPLTICPNCKSRLSYDEVDADFGQSIKGNFRCDECHWLPEDIPITFNWANLEGLPFKNHD